MDRRAGSTRYWSFLGSRASATRLGRPTIGKNLLQLVSGRDFELVVAAIAGRLVGAPAQEDRRVAEAVALHVVVLNLAHALDAQRLPRQVLARAPAALTARHPARFRSGAGPLAPRMLIHGVLAQRLELGGELLARRHGERGGHAHVLQHALVVV